MQAKWVNCDVCGRKFLKPKYQKNEHDFCCAEHSRLWNAKKLSEYNRTSNPMNQPGGVLEARIKRSRIMREKCQGQSYRKMLGKIEHRRMAEMLIGRELIPGEVVHHIDGDKFNNDPYNLEVFPSQAEHVKTQPRDAKGRWCR